MLTTSFQNMPIFPSQNSQPSFQLINLLLFFLFFPASLSLHPSFEYFLSGHFFFTRYSKEVIPIQQLCMTRKSRPMKVKFIHILSSFSTHSKRRKTFLRKKMFINMKISLRCYMGWWVGNDSVQREAKKGKSVSGSSRSIRHHENWAFFVLQNLLFAVRWKKIWIFMR